ncbi:GTPase Era [Caviibacter abscessus]|uniref:GTPase Era n=1 Tax=Caviibacter abscessus TaxID=1766719 RepID=UPI0008375A24|nr:GTPase Era [Caviibacter abscessus]
MKSGFIAIVGRPNVGKSTLMNKLISEKLAIISDKAGTTRDKIRGISNRGENQFIFIDTPGIHKPKHLLGEYMTNVAIETLDEADVILFILDGTKEISTGDMFINDIITKTKTPCIVVINKNDKMSDDDINNKLIEIKEKLGEYFANIINITAEFGIGIHKIYDECEKYLSSDVWYYPQDYYTDMPVNKIVVEIIREKLLLLTKDEVPHSIAVEIIDVETKGDTRHYNVVIYVERDSQKGIVIGDKGSLIKKVGILSRKEIEALSGFKINLKLWVKVRKKWQKDKKFLKDMGYSN